MIIIRFTTRERYCKALRHLFENRDKYRIECRGKDYGAKIKAPNAECGWYILFSVKW